ncbi:hypothetical protein [Thiocystis violacea]|uniref:hypothetical protein n=1 Tax=Thiocystis violacea TaxID=13725 RepID=UPI001903C59B|nr:hypothetical protein [Thiocystis violacea]MBK1719788.1 hypothetical protein [Thiocystis violacea]
MIGKLLLTLAVLLGAYAVIRARFRAASGSESSRPLVPIGAVRLVASILIAVMALGSSLYVFQVWRHDQERVQVRVINANTGRITNYESRRGSIEGRVFKTLDGSEIRLADVERMIILSAESDSNR